MDFFEVVQKRHSVRAYKPDPVEDEKLEKILEAARFAPTAVNYQPFKVFIIKTKGHETKLKRIYGRDWFVEAPYVLCVCNVKDKCWIRRDGKSYGDVDATIIMDHIILAATAVGLGTCWIGAFDVEAARSVLELEENLEPVVLTPLGYEREATVKKNRKPIDELVVYK